ncbi:MAG: 4-hydroxythreonine-4-phosphate dehydrogenase PdxA, partial [Thermotoga sp.]
ITLGDPSGIGPEIVLKALKKIPEKENIIVFGSKKVLAFYEALINLHVNLSNLKIITSEEQLTDKKGHVLFDIDNIEEIFPGKLNMNSGKAAFEYIKKATEFALKGTVSAIVTAPINKAAVQSAGYKFNGHTEILSYLTKTHKCYMLLYSEKLSAAHVTTHISLKKVSNTLKINNIVEVVKLVNEFYHKLGKKAKIGVSCLNPHCGEGGIFGNEEIEIIGPAIKYLKETSNINIQGPFPADTIFLRGIKGEFDVIIAMYHDQGHIPMKLIAFHKTVDVTLGLPIIRTSVDHGTAFDIVGKGVADETNLLEAYELAKKLCFRLYKFV